MEIGYKIMEETQLRPKPMVEIGGNPILWNIMKVMRNLALIILF